MTKSFTTFGLLTILFWLSFAAWFFVYPVSLDLMLIEPSISIGAASIVVGIISGVLLIVHPSLGRMLAISLCVLMILVRMWSLLYPISGLGKRLYVIFFMVLPWRPIYVVHNELVAWTFLVATIVFLWRRRLPNDADQSMKVQNNVTEHP